MRTDRLRVGIVGVGTWANMAHLPAFAAKANCVLAAVADQDAQRAEAACRRFGIAHRYRTLDELLAREDVDLIDVCTGTAGHYALSMQAIEAGKHVLCEKPLGRDLDEAYGLAAAAKRRSLLTAVGFTFRHSPAVQRFKALIDDGYVGRIYHVQGFEQNSLYHDPTQPRPAGWWGQGDAGALGGYASHLVDLVRWTVGDFEEVVGDMQTFIPERAVNGGGMGRSECDDSTMFLAKLAGGVQGVFEASWLAAGRPPGVEIRVFGDRGGLKLHLTEHPDGDETLLGADIAEGIYRPVAGIEPAQWPMEEWPQFYFSRLVSNFADAVLAGGTAEGSFEDGWRCQQVLDAVALASRERRWVRTEEVSPVPAH